MNINNDLYDKEDIRKLFKIVLVIWSLCAVYLSISHWDIVTSLHFNDNDDFMRFHQYREWLKNGNWYLEPIPQFSPNNQLIMHWSRLVDIPLALFASLFSLFFELPTAFAITNTLVPLLYLLVFLFLVSLVAYRLFGLETAKIAMIIPLISPLSMRFLPGALDHHNLQFILLTLFILFSPVVSQSTSSRNAFFSALSMVLSLWIGLENIYTFVAILFLLTLWGYFFRAEYLVFCQSICLIAIVLIPVCLVLNRPADEFLVAHYDVLSFPFWLCFISAFVFCYSLNRFSPNSTYQKVGIYFSLGVIVLLPVVLSYPELVKGGYANYPALLKNLWLDNVSEARSIFQNINEDIKDIGYLLAISMALFSFYFFDNKNIKLRVLYMAFIINMLLAAFWQIRMFSTALVCAIPLQAYVCFRLREKFNNIFAKMILLFLSFPSFVLIMFLFVVNINNEQLSKKSFDNFDVIEFLNKNHITGKNTLATIDLGAPIIVGTDNAIISAPYHRNIEGNLNLYHFFLSKDDKRSRDILDKYNIDYVILDSVFYQNTINSDLENSMLEKIFENKNIPDYLDYVDSSEFIKLYKYVGKNK